MSTSELKNVVLVGFGIGSTALATTLRDKLPATHRLVIITADQSAYSNIASVRAIVVPGWEDKIVIPLDHFLPKDSRHVLLQGTRVTELRKNSVIVDKEHSEKGFGTEITFDKAIIHTGSKQAEPWVAATGSDVSTAKANLKAFQSSLSSAKSILVAGGGPVGFEAAAEVKVQYPDKAVTLVTNAPTLLAGPGIPAAVQNNVLRQVKALGIDVVLGQKVDVKNLKSGAIESQTFELENGKKINADFLLVATGARPNTDLIQHFDASLIDEKTGRVKVKPTLQLDSADGSLDHIFAGGDIANTKELKTFVTSTNHAPIISANIQSLIAGKTAGKNYKPGSVIIIASVGPKGGAGVLFGWNVGTWFPALVKSKTMFIANFAPMYGYRP